MSAVISKPLLIELFTEELPPKALKKLGEAFAAGVEATLRSDGLLAEGASAVSFATPRRLGVRVDAVLTEAPAKAVKEKLMPLAVAKDAAGNASVALKKKLAALGHEALATSPLALTREGRGDDAATSVLIAESDGKAEYVYLVGSASGKSIAIGVQNAIDATLAKLPIPKVMTYQLADGKTDVSFVRPAHGLVVLHGDDVIAATTLGLNSGRITHGHRFQGANNIELDTASRYEELLRQYGKVEPIFATRRDTILSQLEAKASALGATLGAPASYTDLLDEVNSLVEWPTVYVCQFEAEFLAVPQECLILTMKTNQKYFPLFDGAGKLKNQFLIVSNMELDNPKKIIEGNERVVRPRLADARFFFETDKKTRLDARIPELAKVVYHNKLGSLGERVTRVSKLAGEIAVLIGADKARAERGALLAKADLVTQMVGEFPELQGTMGRYYALHDGEPTDVAAACAEHYQPRFAGDALPSPGVPTAVALADKLETLAGLFGIGQTPTGDKDPFALRRHALGVIRILVEQNLSVSLRDLLMASFDAVKDALMDYSITKEGVPRIVLEMETFIYDRLRGYLKDTGASTNEIESVVADSPSNLATLPAQLAAVQAFSALPEATSLNAANKRVANILRKAAESGETIAASNAAQEPAEQALRGALDAISPAATALFAQGNFAGYLKSFAALKAPVDEFFDKVMVMAEDKAVRANRLALLRDLRDAMNKVADLSNWRLKVIRMKLVILDRDGVINIDSDRFIKSPDEWRPIPGSLEAIARLNGAGFHVAVATNQSGVERGLLDMNALNAIHAKMLKAAQQVGGHIDVIYYCPHSSDTDCRCRKPLPGMFIDIGQRLNVLLDGVPCVGDSLRDLQAAATAGGKPYLVLTGKGAATLAAGNLPKGTQTFNDLSAAVEAILA